MLRKQRCNIIGQAVGESRQAVARNITEALEAIVAMDTDLKKDLKSVKGDLGTLKGKISELGNGLEGDGKSNELVKDKLEALEKQKEQLEKVTGKPTGSIHMAMGQLEGNFKTHIQKPLNLAVSAVDEAIGTLGGKFDSKQNIAGIFEHIKSKVGEIKGTSTPKAGLEGIAAGLIHSYASGFAHNGKPGFNGIVTGWMEGTLGNNDHVLKPWLPKYVEDRNGKGRSSSEANRRRDEIISVRNGIIKSIEEKFKEAIEQAGQKVKLTDGKIQTTIESVKKACLHFVGELDQKLRDEGIGTLSQMIFEGIQNADKSGKDYLKVAVESTLLGLSATTSQVANEIDSILLGDYRIEKGSKRSIASELDRVVDETRKLDKQLTAATATNQGTDPNVSPAQAVDSKLAVVRKMVESQIENDFRTKVKQELAAAVDNLPTAVGEFNQQAQEQIKAAAKAAITAAAGQISNSADVSDIKLGKHLMEKFEEAHGKIKSGLESQLQGKVDDHIGKDDPPGQQGGTISDLAKNNFTSYEKHVVQEKIKTGNLKGEQGEGLLPEAIGNIKTVGLKELTIIDKNGGAGGVKITDQTFEVPFKEITKQLEEIKKLVDGASFMDDNGRGVKAFLNELKAGLNDKALLGSAKGLETIRSAIDGLQTTTFTKQPAAIGQAVTQIKAQLGELRGKLKNTNKDDVIQRLTDLQSNGLDGKNTWKQVNGQPLSDLGKIHGDLQEQNEQLGNQTKAIDSALRAIAWELPTIKIILDNALVENDLVDNLKKLQHRIGKGKKVGLQAIYNVIAGLQKDPFNTQPKTIEQAKQQIVKELTALRDVLQGRPGEDVINALNDLMDNGLSGKPWKSKNSLKSIEDELQHQQNTLSLQPKNIDQGVAQITGELQRLQKQLNTEVTDKLKKLKEHGLNEGKQPWTFDDKNLNGIQKITTDIVTIKTENVEDVRHYVVALCSAVRHNARDLRDILQEVKEIMLDKELRKIYSDIYNLLFGPLDNVIQLLKKFDKYAAEAAKRIIADLHAFVNKEVKAAEETLIGEARRQYVSNIKEALKLFAQKVEEELSPLPPLINEDLQMGYKGFMIQVEGEICVNINRLKDVKSRELQALSSAFGHFFGTLNEHLRKEIERLKKHGDDEKNSSPPATYCPRLGRGLHLGRWEGQGF
ncbi:Extracellular matrix-binding ebh, putative [Babesia ovata]|uniref:Extracellular matrix-binding ebh, putative n=1 Tax=Babesia ovata TaxID=189622 RepID=A0A2H6KHT6_9APIC|nr:Extracellular matrix-binding ebh, putative [Babesia ovata]GBE62556.1 Extracellular matrix-binding ebh, putative [Babesia ovata]